MSRSILLLLFQLASTYTFIKSEPILFDLNVDPNERSKISVANPDTGVETDSDYTDSYAQLVERSAHWQQYVIAGQVPDGSVKKKTWKKNYGISTWNVNENFTVAEIPQKYEYKDAPNIVFILVDDWVRFF